MDRPEAPGAGVVHDPHGQRRAAVQVRRPVDPARASRRARPREVPPPGLVRTARRHGIPEPRPRLPGACGRHAHRTDRVRRRAVAEIRGRRRRRRLPRGGPGVAARVDDRRQPEEHRGGRRSRARARSGRRGHEARALVRDLPGPVTPRVGRCDEGPVVSLRDAEPEHGGGGAGRRSGERPEAPAGEAGRCPPGRAWPR